MGDGEGSNLIASVSTLAVVLLGGCFLRVAFGMRAAAARARFLARAQLFTWGVWTCTNIARLLKAFLRPEEELLEDIESALGAMCVRPRPGPGTPRSFTVCTVARHDRCSDQGESALQQSVLIELGLLSPLLGRSLRIPTGFMLANIGLTLVSAGRLGWLFPSHSYPTRMAHCLIAPYIGSFVASALLLCATGVTCFGGRAHAQRCDATPRITQVARHAREPCTGAHTHAHAPHGQSRQVSSLKGRHPDRSRYAQAEGTDAPTAAPHSTQVGEGAVREC